MHYTKKSPSVQWVFPIFGANTYIKINSFSGRVFSYGWNRGQDTRCCIAADRKKKSAKGELGKITCEQLYTINGETHNISEWEKIVGISKGNMKARFDQQLCDEDLLRKKRGKKNGKEKE